MNAMVIVALAVAIPVILFPAAFVWYLNIGGMVHALRAKAAQEKKVTVKTTT